MTGFDDVVQLACGDNFTVGVRLDGTVVFSGANNIRARDCESWSNVVLIDAEGINSGRVVAVRADGTAIAVGDNEYGECDVGSWKDIVVCRRSSYNDLQG